MTAVVRRTDMGSRAQESVFVAKVQVFWRSRR